MQAVYAYQQKVDTNFNLALEYIDDKFAPDLNSMEVQDHGFLNKQKKKTRQLFVDFKKFKTEYVNKAEDEIVDAVNDAWVYFINENKGDLKTLKDLMLLDVENIHKEYFNSLWFVSELASFESKKYKNKLLDSRVFKVLKNNERLQSEVSKRGLSWEQEDSLVKRLFRDFLVKEDFYKEYSNEECDFEKEIDFAKKLVKRGMFKNDLFNSEFDEVDLRWAENKEMVSSMVRKTLKNITEEGDVKILELTENWKDDKDFFLTLFDLTVAEDSEVNDLVNNTIKNWDTDRVSMTDKIILNMAVHEMLNFKDIPVKVTINEYIELSKNYSTPKSKKFVNGVLDAVSKKLDSENKIKKSGRGLIDNK